MSASSDRNLLFGLLALKMDFVSRDALLEGMAAWLDRKADPLGLILQERGALAADDRLAVEALLERHVARHGGDAKQSLASLRVEASVRESLSAVPDTEVGASVGSVALETAGSSGSVVPVSRNEGAMRYRAVCPHARGGLGEVSVALDEELGREVALKEIQPRFADHAGSRARFVREAEITGKLEHPGIVPVYGLGHYPDGRPYYAMKFIRGQSLHAAIARFHEADRGRRPAGERELALRELLGRFVAVCNAVAYAHSRGIVHRDLKPDNVMLGEYGETLVVDWGLAKLVGEAEDGSAIDRPVKLSGGGTAATLMGQAVGTPAYMPPEQARGEHDKVEGRSDVFALGATLYHLLTGQAPLRSLQQAERAEVAPARQINARVPAALEAVCARAMAAAPEGRYPSARALAADVERWLADEAVTAMPEPVREKARRWAKRNRPLVSSGVVLLAASVVGLGVGLAAVRAEERRTAEARDEAVNESKRAVKAEGVATANLERAKAHLKQAEINDRLMRGGLQRSWANFQLARKVVDESFGLAKDHQLFKGEHLSPELRQAKRLLLEKALPFYREFRIRRTGDPEVERDVWDQYMRVAYIQDELGSKPEALENYRLAEQVGRGLVKAHPAVPVYQNNLAGTLTDLGILQQPLGQHEEALRNFHEASRLLRTLVQAQPSLLRYQAGLATTLTNLGLLQRDHGQGKEAMLSYQEAAKLFRTVFDAQPAVPQYQNKLAATLTNLGALQNALGRRKEALINYQEAARLRRALVESQPSLPQYQRGLASTLTNMGILQSDQGQPKEALRNYLEAAKLLHTLVQAHPTVPEFQNDLARILANLGALQSELGQSKVALLNYEEAVRLLRSRVQAQPSVSDYRLALCQPLLGQAMLLRRLGRAEESRRAFDDMLTHLAGLAQTHPRFPRLALLRYLAHVERGQALVASGKPRAAVADFDRALALAPPRARLRVRLDRAVALARASEHHRAAAEALDLARFDLPQADCFNLACVLSLSAAAAGRDVLLPLPLRDRLAEQHARAAVALLHRASRAGWRDAAHADRDRDLDFLRPRPDYQRWRATLPPAKAP